MDNINDVYRKLHHLGIFLIGLSAVVTCFYFVFIKTDPMDELMKKAMDSAMYDFDTFKTPELKP